MKQSRFTDEQIIGFLKQADAGMSVKELTSNSMDSTTLMYLANARLAAAAGLGKAFCRAASNDSWTVSLIT